MSELRPEAQKILQIANDNLKGSLVNLKNKLLMDDSYYQLWISEINKCINSENIGEAFVNKFIIHWFNYLGDQKEPNP